MEGDDRVSRDRDRYARIPGRSWRTAPLSALSLEAAGLLWRAWAYCADQMTDGVVPEHELPSLAKGRATKRIVEELLERGIWERTDGGYRDTVFAAENITRAEWEHRKAGARDRQDKSRRKRREGDASVTRDNDGDPLTQDAGRRTQDSLGSESDAGARAAPRDPADPMRELLLDGFGRRWSAALGEGAWDRSGVHEDHIGRVLRVVRQRPGPEGELERGLDAYFAHCAKAGIRPELGWQLSRDFGSWCARSSLPAGQASSREHRRSLLKELAGRPIPGTEEGAP